MPNINNIAPRDCIRALKKQGFTETKGGKGSHVKLVKGSTTVIVPTAKNPIPIGTMRKILQKAGIQTADFLNLV